MMYIFECSICQRGVSARFRKKNYILIIVDGAPIALGKKIQIYWNFKTSD